MIKRERYLLIGLIFATLACENRVSETDDGSDGTNGGHNPTAALRQAALSEADNDNVVVMDYYVGDEIVSVLASSEGAASIYLSSGGGTIGGETHDAIRNAAIAFVTEAMKQKPSMQRVTTFPYPEKGTTRFYLRVREGTFMAGAPATDLESGVHELSGLFDLGQEVVTQFRLEAESN